MDAFTSVPLASGTKFRMNARRTVRLSGPEVDGAHLFHEPIIGNRAGGGDPVPPRVIPGLRTPRVRAMVAIGKSA